MDSRCPNCGKDMTYNYGCGDCYEKKIAQLRVENEELKADIKRFEKCFERIAKAHGLTTPLELIAMAKDNEENYAEILARHIEQTLEGE